MSNQYKFNPHDFKNKNGIEEDLQAFYDAHRFFIQEPTQSNYFTLRRKGEELFFTIKHAHLFDLISDDIRNALLDEIEVLLDDGF